ncbi:MAG: signal peptidase I [Candidatus Shapirobacteria bacterium]|jgi:signal peptidase
MKNLYLVVVFCLIAIASLSAMSVLGLPQNLRAFVVLSGSMAPSLKTGSLIFVKPSSEYKVGDIVTFKAGSDADIKNPANTVTHRVIDIKFKDNQISYLTKGDANTTPDLDPRPAGHVLGRVILSIPYIGYPVGYAKTQQGFILLVVIPATLIVYSELINIQKSVAKLIKNKKKHGQKT